MEMHSHWDFMVLPNWVMVPMALTSNIRLGHLDRDVPTRVIECETTASQALVAKDTLTAATCLLILIQVRIRLRCPLAQPLSTSKLGSSNKGSNDGAN